MPLVYLTIYLTNTAALEVFVFFSNLFSSVLTARLGPLQNILQTRLSSCTRHGRGRALYCFAVIFLLKLGRRSYPRPVYGWSKVIYSRVTDGQSQPDYFNYLMDPIWTMLQFLDRSCQQHTVRGGGLSGTQAFFWSSPFPGETKEERGWFDTLSSKWKHSISEQNTGEAVKCVGDGTCSRGCNVLISPAYLTSLNKVKRLLHSLDTTSFQIV